MVLTASSALSPAIGLVCHRRLRIKAGPRPVGPTRLRRLDAGVEASGPHDFTVRVILVRPRAPDRSRKTRPAITSTHSTLPRPPHPIPTFVTITIRPFVGDETATDMQVIWANMESKYFCERGWTGKSISSCRANQQWDRYRQSQPSGDFQRRNVLDLLPARARPWSALGELQRKMNQSKTASGRDEDRRNPLRGFGHDVELLRCPLDAVASTVCTRANTCAHQSA